MDPPFPTILRGRGVLGAISSEVANVVGTPGSTAPNENALYSPGATYAQHARTPGSSHPATFYFKS